MTRRDPLGGDEMADRVREQLPDGVDGLLHGLASSRGWEERLQEARVHEVWEKAAGQDLARHVRPVRLHGGVLVLEAASPAWATQIRYLTADLARRVNEELGADHVTHVRVVTGNRGR